MRRIQAALMAALLATAFSVGAAAADPIGPMDMSGANLPPGEGLGIYDVSAFGKCVMHGELTDNEQFTPLEAGPQALIVNPEQSLLLVPDGLTEETSPFEKTSGCGVG